MSLVTTGHHTKLFYIIVIILYYHNILTICYYNNIVITFNIYIQILYIPYATQTSLDLYLFLLISFLNFCLTLLPFFFSVMYQNLTNSYRILVSTRPCTKFSFLQQC